MGFSGSGCSAAGQEEGHASGIPPSRGFQKPLGHVGNSQLLFLYRVYVTFRRGKLSKSRGFVLFKLLHGVVVPHGENWGPPNRKQDSRWLRILGRLGTAAHQQDCSQQDMA